eukprot:GHVT01009513.1.p1 GENE.GHVT01009513.1~~GHVT01009513.1.p1  ORF type:complete len:215 (-),score=37.00 GHVT01009513.1:774-1418(-)
MSRASPPPASSPNRQWARGADDRRPDDRRADDRRRRPAIDSYGRRDRPSDEFERRDRPLPHDQFGRELRHSHGDVDRRDRRAPGRYDGPRDDYHSRGGSRPSAPRYREHRSRSNERDRRRTTRGRSPGRGPGGSGSRSASAEDRSGATPGGAEDENLSEGEMLTRMMGFGNFDTSKGKPHAAAECSGVNVKTKRKYRQYMNRKGGFNRPLSPIF